MIHVAGKIFIKLLSLRNNPRFKNVLVNIIAPIITYNYNSEVKKIFKFSLVPLASKVKFLLVLQMMLPNNLSEIYIQINLH